MSYFPQLHFDSQRGKMVPKNCVICETQVDGKVMERHMGKHNMEGIKLSNDMKEAIKTRCLICKETFIVNKMRVHVKAKHQITITEYKEKQLMGAPYKLVERVFHRYVNMFSMHHILSKHFNHLQQVPAVPSPPSPRLRRHCLPPEQPLWNDSRKVQFSLHERFIKAK